MTTYKLPISLEQEMPSKRRISGSRLEISVSFGNNIFSMSYFIQKIYFYHSKPRLGLGNVFLVNTNLNYFSYKLYPNIVRMIFVSNGKSFC